MNAIHRAIESAPGTWRIRDRQLTEAEHGHILTNIGCWSACGEEIVFDTRSDPAGSVFDGRTIQSVRVRDGRVCNLVTAQHGSSIGVVTCCPRTDRIVFIQGPDHPDAQWNYGPTHRRGVIFEPGAARAIDMDAVCVSEPFTAGALRGGSHVHTFDGDGKWVAFTYEDHVLQAEPRDPRAELNQRNIGISVPGSPVEVHQGHPRNVSGEYFSVLISRTWDRPRPGSDDIQRAYEDAWIGCSGYLRSDCVTKQRATAFIGDTLSESGAVVPELFIIDIPDDVTHPGREGPLEGTRLMRPRPPAGTVQRRLTRTHGRRFPGLALPRHWPRSTPDGDRIFFLMRDEQGIVQLWCIDPLGGEPQQVSFLASGVESAFSVSNCGRNVAHIADGSVCVTEVPSGKTYRITEKRASDAAPRPEACVFSPDGSAIAYVRPVKSRDAWFNQICVVEMG